ncbi:MAG: Gfo/Idh/MocA family oxidoreductase [Aigarchaeota archaeon]|nr:Gfo/Idh/MocA family oxidoreductase [Aigarchaeota archaeon]MCX8192277.1 Gfo/Idh/MocA family oxidoreductase [Nitrososphaeria archaeon]MDW7986115.1 Gfo/Idh/MocA family oxidoreductase [Nitrososphaerota archaeon]
MEVIKIGVIGVGFWGRNHVRVFSEIPNVEVEAVCDIDYERAKQVALKYKVKNYHTSIDEVLEKYDLHAVSICTPSISHAELTIKSLQAGVNVFVEKPLASNLEDCLKVIDAVKSSGKIVMTGFIERFNPAVRKARELLDSGEVGDIIMTHSRRIGQWPERVGDVGVVKDTSIHDIDLARYIFRDDPLSVYAKGGKQKHIRLEDHVQAILSFKRGTAFIEANWLTPRKKREMYITGAEGVITIQFLTQQIILEKADIVLEPIIKYEEPLKVELEYFVESIKNKVKPFPDEVDGAKAVAIAESILESIKKNKVVELNLRDM